MAYRLRIAQTPEEIEAVQRFRYEVVKEDGHLDRYAWADGYLDDGLDEQSTLVYVQEGGAMIGTLRHTAFAAGDTPSSFEWMFDLGELKARAPGTPLSVSSKMMIDPAYRGRGAALMMLQRLAAIVLDSGAKMDLVVCEPAVLMYYLRYGYRQYGGLAHFPNGEVTPRLVLHTTDYGYARLVGSPVLGRVEDRVLPSPGPWLAFWRQFFPSFHPAPHHRWTRELDEHFPDLRQAAPQLSDEQWQQLLPKLPIIRMGAGEWFKPADQRAFSGLRVVKGELHASDGSRFPAGSRTSAAGAGEISLWADEESYLLWLARDWPKLLASLRKMESLAISPGTD